LVVTVFIAIRKTYAIIQSLPRSRLPSGFWHGTILIANREIRANALRVETPEGSGVGFPGRFEETGYGYLP
jgi:hypothetical protein